jgi:hypothetical protein
MTRRDFARVSALAAFAPALRAQTAGQRGKSLVDKTIYALGGDAFRNLRGRTEIGRAYSFYHEQLSGLSIARVYTKYLPPDSLSPVKMVQRQVFGKKLDEAVIFGEKEAWDVTYRGATQIAADRFDQFRDSTLHDIFYILRQRLGEPGLEIEAKGTEVVENQTTETLEIFDSENRSVTVWVSATTFLPVRQRFLRWDPTIKDRIEETANYTKYRESGNGVMLPWATERERDKQRIFQMYSDHVSVTEPLADNLFELSPGVKILKKN